MRKTRRNTVFGAALLAFAILASACGSGGDVADGSTIIVGSTNFSEQEILAEIYAQALEDAGFNVEKKFKLGARDIVEPAIESGEIGLYVEYIGTVLEFLNGGAGEASGDAGATHEKLVDRFAERGVTALDYASAYDSNAIVVTQATADEYSLSKTSDLEAISSDLIFGGPPECPERPFCLIGLTDVYGLDFAEFKPLDVGGPITVAALEGGEINVGLLFSSDGAIAAKGFVVLEDDKELQPADNIVPVVRTDLVDEFGSDMTDLINDISAKITTGDLSVMNKRVNIDFEDASAVAQEWLVEFGFIDG